jgi:hypothetical protein
VGDYQGGALHFLNHVRHREGFSRAGHAHEDLMPFPRAQAADQRRDRGGLVTGGGKGGSKLKHQRKSRR